MSSLSEADNTDAKQGLVAVIGGGSVFKSYLKDNKLYVKFKDPDEGNNAIFKVKKIKADDDYNVQASFDGDKVKLYVDDVCVGKKAFEGQWDESNPHLTDGSRNSG